MVPLSLEVFLGTLMDFNRQILPLQVLAIALGLGVLWLAVRPQSHSGRLIGLALAISWATTGVFYHLNTFAELNFWDYPFGAIFLVQALALLLVGGMLNRFEAHKPASLRRTTGLLLGLYALIAPPLVGAISGRAWDAVGYFASSPGATIVFTSAVLLILKGRGTLWLWGLVLVSALPVTILGSAMSIIEDIVVLPIVIAALVLSVTNQEPRPSV